MNYCWMSFVLFSCAVLELCLGKQGFTVPVTALAGFYLAVAFNWKSAVFPMLAAAVALDSGYGRPFPFSIFTIPWLLLLASGWRKIGNTGKPMLQILPGMTAGAVTTSVTVIYAMILASLEAGVHFSVQPGFLLRQILISAVVLVLMSTLLDKMAKALSLRRYKSASRFQRIHDLYHN